MRIAMACAYVCVLALAGCTMGDSGAVEARSKALGKAIGAGDTAAARAMMNDGLVYTDADGKKHTGADEFLAVCKTMRGSKSFDLSVSNTSEISTGKYAAICTVQMDSATWKLKMGWAKTDAGWMLAAVNDLTTPPSSAPPSTPVASAPSAPAAKPTEAPPAATPPAKPDNGRGGDARMSTRNYIGDKVQGLQGGSSID